LDQILDTAYLVYLHGVYQHTATAEKHEADGLSRKKVVNISCIRSYMMVETLHETLVCAIMKLLRLVILSAQAALNGAAQACSPSLMRHFQCICTTLSASIEN